MKKHALLFLALLFVVDTKKCFLSCGSFDNCNNTKCGDNQCGRSAKNLNLAFTVEECPTEDDFCIYREFLLEETGVTESIEIPGGCLSTYQRSFNQEKFLFTEGVTLFACEGEFCNPPTANAGCSQTQAQARRDGVGQGCELLNGDKLDQIFFDSDLLHDSVGVADRRQFCINNNRRIVFELGEDPECFGETGPGVDQPSTCTLAVLPRIPVTKCDDCIDGLIANCSVDEKTPPPTPAPTTNVSEGEFPGDEEEDGDGELVTAIVAGLSGVGLCTVVGVLVLLFVGRRGSQSKGEYVVPQEDVFIVSNQEVQALKTSQRSNVTAPGVEIVDSNLDGVVVQKPDDCDSDEESLEVAEYMEEML